MLLLGPPGVGKTHLAIALGTEAIVTGSSVCFVTIQDLVSQFQRARDENKLKERMSLLVKPKLLILDEMGYLTLDSFAATCLFQLVSERYEKGSIILTSNKSYGDWGAIFADNVIASAMHDRSAPRAALTSRCRPSMPNKRSHGAHQTRSHRTHSQLNNPAKPFCQATRPTKLHPTPIEQRAQRKRLPSSRCIRTAPPRPVPSPATNKGRSRYSSRTLRYKSLGSFGGLAVSFGRRESDGSPLCLPCTDMAGECCPGLPLFPCERFHEVFDRGIAAIDHGPMNAARVFDPNERIALDED